MSLALPLVLFSGYIPHCAYYVNILDDRHHILFAPFAYFTPQGSPSYFSLTFEFRPVMYGDQRC